MRNCRNVGNHVRCSVADILAVECNDWTRSTPWLVSLGVDYAALDNPNLSRYIGDGGYLTVVLIATVSGNSGSGATFGHEK